jgi:hypothetical protein
VILRSTKVDVSARKGARRKETHEKRPKRNFEKIPRRTMNSEARRVKRG